MGVYTLFGINGIGKDTIANEIRKDKKDIDVTSMSRLLMYILGISKSYDVQEKISEKQYKRLEETPQSVMKSIENNQYRELLEKIAKEDKDVIILSHLVSALRLGNKIKYLDDRKTPDWFIDINDELIQLVAPAQVVAEHRKNDKTRKRNCDIAEIEEHQKLCSIEWERIKKRDQNTADKMSIVENIDLNQAVEQVENIILKRNKETRNNFLQNLRVDVDYSKIKSSNLQVKGGEKEIER